MLQLINTEILIKEVEDTKKLLIGYDIGLLGYENYTNETWTLTGINSLNPQHLSCILVTEFCIVVKSENWNGTGTICTITIISGYVVCINYMKYATIYEKYTIIQ